MNRILIALAATLIIGATARASDDPVLDYYAQQVHDDELKVEMRAEFEEKLKEQQDQMDKELTNQWKTRQLNGAPFELPPRPHINW